MLYRAASVVFTWCVIVSSVGNRTALVVCSVVGHPLLLHHWTVQFIRSQMTKPFGS